MSYDTSDLERRRRRLGVAALAIFCGCLALVALIESSASAVDADRPGTTDAAPPAAVFGPAAPDAPSGAATILASLTPPPTLSGAAAGSEGRQGAPESGATASEAAVSSSALAGTFGLALAIEPVGTASDSHEAVPDPAVWDELAECESHGEWDYNPATATWGSRIYSGGLQFAATTWSEFAPAGFPDEAHDATRVQQIAVAERVRAVQGWGAWPVCSKRTGLR